MLPPFLSLSFIFRIAHFVEVFFLFLYFQLAQRVIHNKKIKPCKIQNFAMWVTVLEPV